MVPMKFLFAPLSIAGVSLAALLGSAASPEPAPFEPLTHTGVVSAYRLDQDGTVYVRLHGSDPKAAGGAQDVWFRSPTDRSTSISVEEMLLDVVVHLGANETLTISAEPDRSLDGASPEEAYPLLSVSKL